MPIENHQSCAGTVDLTNSHGADTTRTVQNTFTKTRGATISHRELAERAEEPRTSISQEVCPITGRLKYFFTLWVLITKDKHVLFWVKGVQIPLKNPIQFKIPNEIQ